MTHRSTLPAVLLAAGLMFAPGLAQAQSQGLQLPRPLLPTFGQSAQQGNAAQASDAAVRVQQLEDHIRDLTGRIEELNFQVLEMQEQIRKMQEDNEFRFQELEGRRGDAGAGSNGSKFAARPSEQEIAPGKSTPSEPQTGVPGSGGDSIARAIEQETTGGANDTVEVFGAVRPGNTESGLEPKTLGTMTFDQNGNVVGTAIEKPIDLTRRGDLPPPANGSGIEKGANGVPLDGSNAGLASLSPANGPDQLYELGYNYIQAGDYELAENTFGDFVMQYPDHPRIAEARFWLGESLYSQGQFEEAARIFLETHKQYAGSRMGAQTLLKLANSLAQLDQRELACATYAEVPKQYPDIGKSVRDKLAADQKSSSCK